MRLQRITSAEDERIADYVGVREAHLRADRPTQPGGLFIAEGEVVLRTLIASAYEVRSVLCTPARLRTIADALADLPDDTPVYVAELAILSRIAGFPVHRGVLAIGVRGSEPPIENLLRADLIVVLEDLANHDNIGGVFRNAAAFGAGAVLLSPRCADPLYRKAVRVSVGHALTVPFARLGPWPGALDRIRDAGFELIGLSPAGAADDVACVGRHAKSALLLGAEGPGLSAGAIARCDRLVRIPISPRVDSLNVATACGIALHHLRQPDQ